MSNLSKVLFELNPADGQRVKTESVWGERLSNSSFRLMNSPFFAFGVSYQDEVEAEPDGEVFRFVRVLRRSGNSTYRVFLQDDRTIKDADFLSRWSELRRLGCTYENANSKWIAVNVPKAANLEEAYRLLEAGEQSNLWAFEEGHCENR